MTDTQPRHARAEPTPSRPDPSERTSRTTATIIAVLAVAVGVLLLVVLVLPAVTGESNGDVQTSGFPGQGGVEPALATDGAELERRDDGLVARVDIPTPEPGSYEYPTGDMVSPWAEPHPPVSPGAANAPEVFTLWLIVFNDPESCTNDQCDADDIAADASARGGVYQVDGRVADGGSMSFVGNVRLGQQPEVGSPLDNPMGADVHLAIAPHGRALSGTDGWRQLNGPVGNPTLWWTAEFSPSQ